MTTTETTQETARKLAQKKKYVHKEPKSFNLSHEAYLLYRTIARERHLGIGDFLEILAQEEAERRLTTEERQRIKDEAKEITQARLAEVEKLEKTARTV